MLTTYIFSNVYIFKRNIYEFSSTFADAFDTNKLLASMDKLRNGQAVDIPNYDFKTYRNNVPPRRVIMINFLTSGWNTIFFS